MINAHTHIYSALVPFGMPRPEREPRDFREILEMIWWPLDRALDERALRAAARLYVAEALLFGTTALVDHHESPSMIEGSLDLIADVCEELGMPALLCYGATERNGGRDEARRGLAECRRFILSNKRALVRGAVGLHAAFTVSDATIAEAGAMCRDLDVPLHVHVAEDRIDRDGFRRLRNAFVPGSILAHGVHLAEDEVRECDAMDLWLVHCPRSNRANGVGAASALRASTRVLLGTDGFPSDMNAEMAAAAPGVILSREDGEGPRPDLPAADPSPSSAAARLRRLRMTLDEIRAGAHAEAERLWKKLKGERCNALQ